MADAARDDDSSSAPPSAAARRVQGTQGLRSRLGCWTCREKKVKCDEERPRCNRCARLDRICDYQKRPQKTYTRRRRVTGSPRVADVDTAAGSTNSSPATTQPSEPVWSADSFSPQTHSGVVGASPLSQRPTVAGAATPLYASDLESALSPAEYGLSPACNLVLSPLDHEAIHHFRFTISVEVDTRVIEHSGPAVIWTLAQRSPLVLHMVCAFGGQRRSYDDALPPARVQACRAKAMEHYGSALTLLSETTQHEITDEEFDDVLAALWLMISYEQRFGDGCGVSMITHFHGASVLLRDRSQSIRNSMLATQANPELLSPRAYSHPSAVGTVSPLGCRIISWISKADGGAAFNGLGGDFNQLLGDIAWGESPHDVHSHLIAFVALHRRSNTLYRDIWGSAYPQSQILEDLETGPLLNLQAETSQLRYLLSRVPDLDVDNSSVDGLLPASFIELKHAIHDVRQRYSDYIEAACILQYPANPDRRRLIMNIRCTVPFFLAVILCFNRAAGKTSAQESGHGRALRDTMDLACKVLDDDGEEPMARLAWPLFVAALETDDLVHRSWILERYDRLQRRGENYRRAREALRFAFMEQRAGGRRSYAASLLKRPCVDKFVLE